MHQSSLESLFSDTTDVAASQQQDTCVEVLSTGCDEVVGGALLPRRRGRVDYRMRIGDDEGDSELLVDMEDIYNLDEELRYDARGGSERGRGGSHGSKKRVGQRCTILFPGNLEFWCLNQWHDSADFFSNQHENWDRRKITSPGDLILVLKQPQRQSRRETYCT